VIHVSARSATCQGHRQKSLQKEGFLSRGCAFDLLFVRFSEVGQLLPLLQELTMVLDLELKTLFDYQDSGTPRRWR
jgi:hypothetical protein